MSNFLIKILLSVFIVFSLALESSPQSKNDNGPVFPNSRHIMQLPEDPGVIFPVQRTVNDSINPLSIDSTRVINENVVPRSNLSYVRLGIVSGTSLAILGGIYYRWKTAWWNDGTTGFHFDYNPTYTDNVDKIGHLYGGILFTECFGLGLRWAGLDEESSLLYGALFSTLVYTGVEIKDGFAPTWGFDPLDLGFSIAGSIYPYAQKKVPFLQNFNFKYSYFPSNSTYFNNLKRGNKNNQFFNDDYEGETFWLAANIKNLLPSDINSFMPDFLNIALGVSIENLDNPSARRKVFVISPDIDLVKLFKPENEILKEVLRLLNYIHIPLPALKISPDFKAYPLYLKP